MKLVVALCFVFPALPYQVAPVRRRVDQDIVRLRLDAALNHGLQVLVLRLKLFEGQVIHKQYEAVIPVFDP